MTDASAAVAVEAEKTPAAMIGSSPVAFVSVGTTSELKEKVTGVEAEVVDAAQAADIDLSWQREHWEVSYYLKGAVLWPMRHLAEPEAVLQVSVHYSQASVVMDTLDQRRVDQQS